MKTKTFFKSAALAIVLMASSLSSSAGNNEGNLIYNTEEKEGVMVGQTIYKKNGSTLANYMKHNYKYDENKRMTESETHKWNNHLNKWENELRVNYAYTGKTITTNYHKWNKKTQCYVLVPEMTVTMDNMDL